MTVVLATTSSFGQAGSPALDLLASHGCRLITNPLGRKLSEAELGQLLAQHEPDGLLAGTEPITRAVLTRAAGHLKAISRVGVGWDNVDRQAAAELGIPVLRTLGVLDQAVAELTLGLMLAALRGIAQQDRCLRECRWEKRMGRLLAEQVVGLIGLGGIGRRVGELCNAFGARVIFSDPQPRQAPWARAVDLAEILATADIISLHADGNQCILGSRELGALARPGVILINTARGGLVDEAALAQGLASGQVACACLDVFQEEPYQGPLAGLENVILTPHVGSYAQEARARMEKAAVSNLLQALNLA